MAEFSCSVLFALLVKIRFIVCRDPLPRTVTHPDHSGKSGGRGRPPSDLKSLKYKAKGSQVLFGPKQAGCKQKLPQAERPVSTGVVVAEKSCG